MTCRPPAPWTPTLWLGALLALTSPALPGDETSPAQAREVGALQDPRIDESSGLAPSRWQAGALWTHNDSGDSPRLFLLDAGGRTRAVVTVDGAEARDWEDMAAFQRGGERWLVVADVGDNASARDHVTLYLLPEPAPPPADAAPQAISVRAARRITLRYADGAHDCETIAVDPHDPQGPAAWLITKERLPGVRPRAYRVPLFGDGDEALRVVHAAELSVPGLTTAGDMSPDGRRLVVLTYRDAFLFERAPDEAWPAALAREPRRLPMPARKQGEAICFDPEARAVWLTSEGAGTPVWEVPLPPPARTKRWF